MAAIRSGNGACRKTTASTSARANTSASASAAPYLNACSNRSAGNPYRHAAIVNEKGGGRARHAPHVNPVVDLPSPSDVPLIRAQGRAQRGHATSVRGMLVQHIAHMSA